MHCEERAELAHLVPEDREVAVVDVEVVVLDVREDSPREREALVEGGALLLGDELAVLGGDPLALRDDRARTVVRCPRRPRAAQCMRRSPRSGASGRRSTSGGGGRRRRSRRRSRTRDPSSPRSRPASGLPPSLPASSRLQLRLAARRRARGRRSRARSRARRGASSSSSGRSTRTSIPRDHLRERPVLDVREDACGRARRRRGRPRSRG